MANLLIVDDLDMKRLWMRGILEAGGHGVVEAENGRDALAKAERGGFDIVITDINMPEMNGVELIHRLREQAASTPKILAISAGTDTLPSDVGLQAGHAVGADAILYMPCRPAELLQAIDALLRP
jgi:CheY-like chemotaxis protein